MLFHFLNFSQCVVCLFGHKTIYKVTNLKVHSKGRYFIKKKKKSLFKNYNERLVWTTNYFSCICDITNFKSHLRKFNWLVGGENTRLSSARFKIKTRCGWFYITVFLMETNFFQKHFGCQFHLILNVMSDKAAFVGGALFCLLRYRGNLALSLQQSLPLAEN